MPKASVNGRAEPQTVDSDRLFSWKQIAAHLGCSVATAQRWERQEGLPISRHLHRKLGSIIASKREVDQWAAQRGRLPSIGSREGCLSLAVLPFENYTGEAAKEYLSDGFTEELITELGRCFSHCLRLIARTSVMQYKGTHETADHIGKRLGVEYVMEGSLQKFGPDFRVTAQLIEAASQRHLWADSYTGTLNEVFAAPKKIAFHTAAKLGLDAKDIDPAPQPRLSPAYDLYLQARFQWFTMTREGMDEALRLYEHALELDPRLAAAYAGISTVWQVRGDAGYIAPVEAYPNARAAAARALELAPVSAFVHAVNGYLLFAYEWDIPGALQEARRALSVNASDVNAYLLEWDCHIAACNFREAEQAIQSCIRLDPYNPFFKCFFGWHLLFTEKFEESVALLRSVVREQPRLTAARLGLWGAFFRQHRYAEAVAEACRFFDLRKEPEIARTMEREFRQRGYEHAMRSAARELAWKAERQYVGALRVARLYGHANEPETALRWLVRAVGERTPALNHLAAGWDWIHLRHCEGFHRIIERINRGSKGQSISAAVT